MPVLSWHLTDESGEGANGRVRTCEGPTACADLIGRVRQLVYGDHPSMSLRIALAQTRQTDDFDDNIAAIFEALDQAAAAGARIVCLPEAQTVGYRVDIVPADAPVPAARLEQVHRDVAARCKELNLACILGTETPVACGKPFNTALVINERGEVLGSHHKSALTPLDAVAYSPGDGTYETFTLCGVCVGVVICFEGAFLAFTVSL